MSTSSTKRKTYYPHERQAALEYANLFGASAASHVYEIPRRTIRNWMEEERKSNLGWRILLWIAEFVGWLIMGMAILAVTMLVTIYLLEGKDEVIYLWQLLGDLLLKN